MSTWVGIEQLQLSPLRPRGPLPRVSPGLLRLVREHGPVNPVVVRPIENGRYEIISNVETWLAAQQAGQHQVPVEVRDDLGEEEAAALMAQAARATAPDPIAEAEDFAERLEALGGTRARGAVARLAREVGKPRTYVSHALRLLKLPARVQDMVRRGELTAGHARALVGITDRRRCLRLAERIVRDRLSVRDAEELARGRQAGPAADEAGGPGAADPNIRRLERELTETLGCPTRIDTAAGRLVIEYYGDLDILGGVLERLGLAEET